MCICVSSHFLDARSFSTLEILYLNHNLYKLILYNPVSGREVQTLYNWYVRNTEKGLSWPLFRLLLNPNNLVPNTVLLRLFTALEGYLDEPEQG